MRPLQDRRHPGLALKISLLTVLLVILAIVVTGVLTYGDYAEDMKGEMGKRLRSIAQTAALGIDGDLHHEIFRDDFLADDVLATVDGEEIRIFGLDAFLSIRQHLRAVKAANELQTEVYTFRRVESAEEAGGHAMEFVVMTDDEPHIGNRLTGLSDEQQSAIDRVFATKRAAATDVYTDPEGTWLSALAPILNSQGDVEAVLEVDYELRTVEAILVQGRQAILLYSTVGTLVAVLLTILVVRWLTRPLQTLAAAMGTLAEGNVPEEVRVTSGDEIGLLSESFNAMLAGLRQRDFLRYTLQRYVGGAVVDEIVKDPSLVSLYGEKRHLTVFFSDIEGFTNLAESLPPEDVVNLLNEYFEHLSAVIFEHGGTLDKYLGDAVMAVWGAPIRHADHAIRACRAALAIQAGLEELRHEWRRANRPELPTRIGINSGDMIVGNIGSSQHLDYTVVGDPVNLGARLESANREYGTQILLSEFTYVHVREHVEVRELDRLLVKGRDVPLTVYELLAAKGQMDARRREVIRTFGEALSRYRNRDWAGALSGFEHCLQLDPADGPSRVFASRCAHFADSPPPDDWAGIHHLTSK